jgi:hypothetical protein
MELRVQLKVCEGCGCLWYRLDCLGSSAYCRGCQTKLKDFPVNTRLPRRAARRGVLAQRPPLLRVWAVAESSGGAE